MLSLLFSNHRIPFLENQEIKKSESAVWWLDPLPMHETLAYGTLGREKCGLEIPEVEKDGGTRPPTSWTHQLINC